MQCERACHPNVPNLPQLMYLLRRPARALHSSRQITTSSAHQIWQSYRLALRALSGSRVPSHPYVCDQILRLINDQRHASIQSTRTIDPGRAHNNSCKSPRGFIYSLRLIVVTVRSCGSIRLPLSAVALPCRLLSMRPVSPVSAFMPLHPRSRMAMNAKPCSLLLHQLRKRGDQMRLRFRAARSPPVAHFTLVTRRC